MEDVADCCCVTMWPWLGSDGWQPVTSAACHSSMLQVRVRKVYSLIIAMLEKMLWYCLKWRTIKHKKLCKQIHTITKCIAYSGKHHKKNIFSIPLFVIWSSVRFLLFCTSRKTFRIGYFHGVHPFVVWTLYWMLTNDIYFQLWKQR